MRHARRDYDSIQDLSNRIPVDEPVFVLRAKDKLAPIMLRIYADLCRSVSAKPNIVQAAEDWARQMDTYAIQVYGGGKVPDVDDINLVPYHVKAPEEYLNPSTHGEDPCNDGTCVSCYPPPPADMCLDCGAYPGEVHKETCANFISLVKPAAEPSDSPSKSDK